MKVEISPQEVKGLYWLVLKPEGEHHIALSSAEGCGVEVTFFRQTIEELEIFAQQILHQTSVIKESIDQETASREAAYIAYRGGPDCDPIRGYQK